MYYSPLLFAITTAAVWAVFVYSLYLLTFEQARKKQQVSNVSYTIKVLSEVISQEILSYLWK